MQNSFKINHDKLFPNLTKAPIVEAVLHWRASASVALTEAELFNRLQGEFPQYEAVPQHNVNAVFSGSPQSMEFKQSATWEGVRLTKSDAGKPRFVCQFKRDGIIFSQLAPYGNWDDFSDEAMLFWKKFVQWGQPNEIARLTTRFISQIPIQSLAEVKDYIEEILDPIASIGLYSDTFFHQDTVELVGHPYVVHLIRSVQHATESKKTLIVDIGATTTDAITNFDCLPEKLKDLRYIKNEIFFTIMKDAETKFGSKE